LHARESASWKSSSEVAARNFRGDERLASATISFFSSEFRLILAYGLLISLFILFLGYGWSGQSLYEWGTAVQDRTASLCKNCILEQKGQMTKVSSGQART
jgi:hypothetical protein